MSDPRIQTTIIPHTQKPLVTRTYPTNSELDAIIQSADEAQKKWAAVPLSERIAIGYKFIVSIVSQEMSVYFLIMGQRKNLRKGKLNFHLS